jgi:hypothetical protein
MFTRRRLIQGSTRLLGTAALAVVLPVTRVFGRDADRGDAPPREQLLKQLYQFVQVEYLGHGTVSQTASPEMYAPTVTYFSRGDITRDQVLAEKRAYYSRWPNRVFEMVEGSLKGQPAGDDEVELFFRYSFDVSNANDSRRGIATATLRVALTGERFVIRGEKGGIEKRY